MSLTVLEEIPFGGGGGVARRMGVVLFLKERKLEK